jgi:hypothetical protein
MSDNTDNLELPDTKENIPFWKTRKFLIGFIFAVIIIVVLTVLFTLNATKDNKKLQAFINIPIRKNIYFG